MTQAYTPKYYTAKPKPDYPGKRGRKPQQPDWKMDRHYGWLKHRAQARFRNEQYNLTEEDWNSLWSQELWHRRGRKSQELSLYRFDITQPWQINNVTVTENRNKGDFYHPQREWAKGNK